MPSPPQPHVLMVVKQPGALQVGTDNDAPEEGHAYGGPQDGGGEDDGLVGDKEVSLDALCSSFHLKRAVSMWAGLNRCSERQPTEGVAVLLQALEKTRDKDQKQGSI